MLNSYIVRDSYSVFRIPPDRSALAFHTSTESGALDEQSSLESVIEHSVAAGDAAAGKIGHYLGGDDHGYLASTAVKVAARRWWREGGEPGAKIRTNTDDCSDEDNNDGGEDDG